MKKIAGEASVAAPNPGVSSCDGRAFASLPHVDSRRPFPVSPHLWWFVLATMTLTVATVFLPRSERSFRKSNRNRVARSAQVQGGDDHRPHAGRCDQRKQRDRLIPSRLVLRWKEMDNGCKAKTIWCVHGFKDPDIHEIGRRCPTTELSSINITLQILASTASEGTLADGEKTLMQGDPTVLTMATLVAPVQPTALRWRFGLVHVKRFRWDLNCAKNPICAVRKNSFAVWYHVRLVKV